MTITPSQLKQIREIAQIATAAINYGPGFPTYIDVDNTELVEELDERLTRETTEFARSGGWTSHWWRETNVWRWYATQLTKILKLQTIPENSDIKDLALAYATEVADDWDAARDFLPEHPEFKELREKLEAARSSWVDDWHDTQMKTILAKHKIMTTTQEKP